MYIPAMVSTVFFLLSVITPQVPTDTQRIRSVCQQNCSELTSKAIASIRDEYFYQEWLKSKKASQGESFNPEEYLLSRLKEIDEMVACESIGFGIQHSIYLNPNTDQQAIVAKVNPEDPVTYQIMRIVSTDIYSETALAHAEASKEGKGFEGTGDQLRKLLDSFQRAVNQRLGKAHLVYKDVGVYNLEGAELQAAYDKILPHLQQMIARGGVVTVYFNYISPADPQKLGKVRHSILADLSGPQFYLFDMNAPDWIVTWGNGNGQYKDLESLLKNALDYIGMAYLQPNVGNRQTALQLAIYSNVD